MTGIIINNIKKYIKNNHIKQSWIADVLGTNKMNISNTLNGRRKNVSLDELNSIIKTLDLDFDEVNKEDFEPKTNYSDENNMEVAEYIAYCGSINNRKTRRTMELVMELIEIIDIFKTNNSNAIFKG
jgi:predicted XRE-type DNA-binding protein